MSKKNESIETRLVHGEDFTAAWDFSNQLVAPMTSNTTYRLKSVERGAEGFATYGELPKGEKIWIYDRLDEPNNLMLEEQLIYMERGEGAVTFASGMGAISAVCMTTLESGDLIYSDSAIYGCTHSLFKNWLPRLNIKTEWKDFTDLKFLDEIPDNLKLLYFESVANPTLKVADIKKICEKVFLINQNRPEKDHLLVAVDNTFATPLGCNPIFLGADFSIHSLTKNISGFGTELGGAVVTKAKWETPLKLARKDYGAVLNSKSSWSILNHGLPTMHLRFNRQQESAQEIARFLKNQTDVENIYYPGFSEDAATINTLSSNSEEKFQPGFMLSFTLVGDIERTKKFVNFIAKESYSITLAVSLGLTKTLIEVPRLMTHSSYDDDSSKEGKIEDKLIRLSVGVESKVDIIKDLMMAFDFIKNA